MYFKFYLNDIEIVPTVLSRDIYSEIELHEVGIESIRESSYTL